MTQISCISSIVYDDILINLQLSNDRFYILHQRGSLTVAPKKGIKSENSIKSGNNKKEKCK